MLKKIISSGNSGAEQGGLACAFMQDLKTGGYCPQGYKTIQGNKPELQFLGINEVESDKFKPAIEKTILESDANINFVFGMKSKLEIEIDKLVIEYGKPRLEIDIQSPPDKRVVVNFITDHKVEVLHITGALDTKDKKVYDYVREYLGNVIEEVKFEYSFAGNHS